jgi:hypothetical protein
VLYALGGGALWRFDVGGRGRTRLADFGRLFGYPCTLAQLSMSDDARVFTFHARDPRTRARRDAAVFDRATGRAQVYRIGAFPLDETRVDRRGRVVLIDGGKAGYRLWDFRAGRVVELRWNETDRPGGHADLGAGTMVNGDGWDTGLIWRSIDAPRTLRSLLRYPRPDGKPNWTIAEHVSMQADGERFAVVSTYGGDGSWSAFENEVFLVFTDGSGVRRLAHTRSANRRPLDYWAQPRATVDRAGRFIVFTSSLGSADRLDVLILQIPSL